MGQPRADGLPNPATVDQLYLAAILEEIRALRADLSARAPGAPTEGPTLEGAAPVLEALGLPTDPEELREQIAQAVHAEEAAQEASTETPDPPLPPVSPLPTPDPAIDGETAHAARAAAAEASKIRTKAAAKKPARTRKAK